MLKLSCHIFPRLTVAPACWAATCLLAAGQPKAPPANPSPPAPSEHKIAEASIQELVRRARQAVVVITQPGRDGRSQSVGSGFVVDPDGLVVTSLHVIGEGRPVSIQLENGKRYAAAAIQAWDRKLDLALIKISATNLQALPLGDSDSLAQGTPVVTIGNPLGLEYSIVQGVVSARRDFDGIEMIQLAMPIEPGNSGGPVLDLEGRVHGIVNLKSFLTPNLGFALPINRLRPLIDKPNPVAIERWLAMGKLDAAQWLAYGGAHWSQKTGRIQVEGWGEGFAGRSVCLYQKATPQNSYQVSVEVRLDDESGAAGLVFEAEDAEKYYGFYPTTGDLRLTRFRGEELSTWQILAQVHTPFYHPGEWNALRVIVDRQKIRCFVNDHPVIEVAADERPRSSGKVGLAKFRQTSAAFKEFQTGNDLRSDRAAPSAELLSAIQKGASNEIAKLDPRTFQLLVDDASLSRKLLSEEAGRIERQAAQLKKLASEVHRKAVEKELLRTLEGPEAEIDLLHAALLIAKWDNPSVDPRTYEKEIDSMAEEIKAKQESKSDRLGGLIEYLFHENGFHGSRNDYYNRANSYLHQVIEDREGQPITLSVLFLELGRKIGVDGLAGLALPGHFLVACWRDGQPARFIDVFEGGKELTRPALAELVDRYAGRPLRESDLVPAPKRQIITRILRNLRAAVEGSEPPAEVIRYVDLILLLDPAAALEREERAVWRFRTGDKRGAKEDLKSLLDQQPDGLRLDPLLELYRSLQEN